MKNKLTAGDLIFIALIGLVSILILLNMGQIYSSISYCFLFLGGFNELYGDIC